jgi:hypothetical protein
MGAASGWARVAGAGRVMIGDYNALKEMDITNSKAVVVLSDLKSLEKTLLELGPDSLKKFKSSARQLGTPARDALRSTFRSVGIHGPLGAPRRKGRNYDKMSTSYERGHLSYSRGIALGASSRGIDVNYKNRNENKALRELAKAQDGTVSIVRLLVKAPAYIVADMAGKSGRAKKAVGSLSREYDTRLFGRNVVTKRHVITPARRVAIDDWLQALDSRAHNRRQGRASRYAWPTMEKYMSKHKTNASQLMNDVITMMNKRLEQ